MEQELVFIRNKFKTWKNPNALKIHFLDALFTLASENPEQNKIGFEPIDLLEQLQKIRGQHWGPKEPEQIPKTINRLWNQAQELWSEKSEGLHQELSLDYEVEDFPEINKVEGGGKGNPSRYRIVRVNNAPASIDAYVLPNPYTENFTLKYVCEDVSNPGFIAKFFNKGFQVSGWRRFLLAATIAIGLLCVLMVLFVLFGQITFWEQFGTEKIFRTTIQFIVIFIAVWMTLASFIELPIKKIVPAPFWLQSSDGDRLLEHRTPPKYEVRTIKAVTYSAKCPICSGKVTAVFSRIEFMGRIVGRCENAPAEHVFSFDHITRSGKYLR